ncbi:MAG: GH3 auxin-responsive promoter family protein, partial [Pseudomonadota bacterium]
TAMAVVSAALLAIIALERIIPYSAAWQPTLKELKTDAAFMLLVQVLLPRGLALAVSVSLAIAIGKADFALANLWPHASPVWAQLLLMIAVADFLRYWLHVACHRNAFLWRFHAVHHETEKLYALNVGRFHPLEKSLQYLFDAAPFVLLAVEPTVLAAYFVFYAINGFFQHANLNVRLGPLNHLISGSELHRWHHHVDPTVAQVNFGNNIILWDTLFGTRYLPNKGEDSASFAVGIRGHLQRYRFRRGIIRAWLSRELFRPALNALLNIALRAKMSLIRIRLWQPLQRDLQQPWAAQRRLLGEILRNNRETEFGREFGFVHVHDYENFRTRVPLQSYDSIEPYVERQQAGLPSLTSERPVLYAKTSGTTGAAKYIPIGHKALGTLKESQSLAGYCHYRACPEAYRGKLLAIVSPAIEGYLTGGAPYGSASGLVVKNMPRLAREKYALPWEVFEIQDHEVRYREILKIGLCQPDITFLGTANPSTLLKLLAVLDAERWSLLDEIKAQCAAPGLPASITAVINKHISASSQRIAALEQLFAAEQPIGFNQLWPDLRLVVTWTGGSCGIPLGRLQRALAPSTQVMELGYIASECRGTISSAKTVVVNGKTRYQQIACLQQNFFEFVERSDWETNGVDGASFRLLHELERGQQYYIIVTNCNGLYRYFMNDIIEVDGFCENTPSFHFVQKGKGVTNITGEKLSEQQAIAAVAEAEAELCLTSRFFLVLADEHNSRYRLLFEPEGDCIPEHDVERSLASATDHALRERNIEYAAKSASGRLGPVDVAVLRAGAGEHYRQSLVEAGQRESQLKYLCLQYQRDCDFDFSEYLADDPGFTPRLVAAR